MTLTRYSYTIDKIQQNVYSYMYVFRQYGTKQLRNLVVGLRVRSLWNGCECLETINFVIVCHADVGVDNEEVNC